MLHSLMPRVYKISHILPSVVILTNIYCWHYNQHINIGICCTSLNVIFLKANINQLYLSCLWLLQNPIVVTLSPPPDLVVSSITVGEEHETGSVMVINYTVTNIGAGAPFEPFWTDKTVCAYCRWLHMVVTATEVCSRLHDCTNPRLCHSFIFYTFACMPDLNKLFLLLCQSTGQLCNILVANLTGVY